jgi:hypothetical protein
MIQASAMLGGDTYPATAKRSGASSNIAAELSLDESQMNAWQAFVETLAANARRLDDVDGRNEHPFGRLQDRVAALASMRQATDVLLSVLDTAQKRRAMRLVPLCCLPTAHCIHGGK